MTKLEDESYIDEIIGKPSPFFYPEKVGQKIEAEKSYHMHAKVGGEYRLISVNTRSEPYRKGKTSMYVDVYGYDFRGSVNVNKLMLMGDDVE